MPSEIEIFREYYSSSAGLGQPAIYQEIAEFETRYTINFPYDVREYFLKINGVYIGGGYITIEPFW